LLWAKLIKFSELDSLADAKISVFQDSKWSVDEGVGMRLKKGGGIVVEGLLKKIPQNLAYKLRG